jgi:hypothetical protein
MEIIACCGLVCHTCPIYLATRLEEEEERTKMRQEIVRICKEQYGINYSLEEITDCDGCQTTGEKLFIACRSCRIRQCAKTKRLENCAYCDGFPCEHLATIFQTEPTARTRLETVRSKRI